MAQARINRLARQWRPAPGSPAASTLVEPVDDAADPWRDLRAAPSPVKRGAPVGWRWRGNRAAVRSVVLLVLACLAVSGWWWWSGRPRPVVEAPIVLETASGQTAPPAISAQQVVVHVSGFVSRPGLLTLPAGSRVADAISSAGGVTRPRAADSVNLARVLVDGEQIVVSASASPGTASAGPAVLDLNLADGAALDQLPGVGPVLAARIVQWRAENGPFRSVDELGEVSGIGSAILAQIRPLVRV